jgi:CHAD domain-containing protein
MSATRRRFDLLAKRLDQFTRMLPELAEGELSAMHRTRVASRRLREIVPILELEPGVGERLGRRLKTVTVELGIVRELGVLLKLVGKLHDTGQFDAQVLRRISSRLADAYSQARERLEERLPVDEVERVAKKLAKIGRDLRDRKPSRAWMWAIDARVHRRATAVLGALDAAGSIYLQERLHDVRIALKKFRYALEISCEAAGLEPSADIRTLKKYQDTLGRMHDLQVLLDRIREIQPSIAPQELAVWRKIDAIVNALEDECRRLHAKFLRQQPAIREIADRVTRVTAGTPRARRAIAS